MNVMVLFWLDLDVDEVSPIGSCSMSFLGCENWVPELCSINCKKLVSLFTASSGISNVNVLTTLNFGSKLQHKCLWTQAHLANKQIKLIC